MYKKTTEIELSGEFFPIYLDNLLLQEIQEEYGAILDFELKLMGWGYEDGKIVTTGDPSIKLINWLLPKMIKEGCIVSGIPLEYNSDDIVRMIDKPPLKIALVIHEEFNRCFERKKKLN